MDHKTLALQIEFAESIPLSIEDLKKITNNECNIIQYHEMEPMTNIDQIFGDFDSCIVLYELQGNIGHFIAVIRNREENKLIHYDSYGFHPDEEMNLFEHKVPLYSRLFYASEYIYDINVYKHQLFKNHSQTCGRHACLRVIYRHLSNDEYNKFITSKPKITNPDQLVTVMTMAATNYINKPLE